jgi:hypothetical protein
MGRCRPSVESLTLSHWEEPSRKQQDVDNNIRKRVMAFVHAVLERHVDREPWPELQFGKRKRYA